MVDFAFNHFDPNTEPSSRFEPGFKKFVEFLSFEKEPIGDKWGQIMKDLSSKVLEWWSTVHDMPGESDLSNLATQLKNMCPPRRRCLL